MNELIPVFVLLSFYTRFKPSFYLSRYLCIIGSLALCNGGLLVPAAPSYYLVFPLHLSSLFFFPQAIRTPRSRGYRLRSQVWERSMIWSGQADSSNLPLTAPTFSISSCISQPSRSHATRLPRSDTLFHTVNSRRNTRCLNYFKSSLTNKRIEMSPQ